MPDLNVWLALSWGSHPHSQAAWNWLHSVRQRQLLFCRFTQIGLLRLLTTQAVMGSDCLTVRKAWDVYRHWLNDPAVIMRREPTAVDGLFEQTSLRFSKTSSPKTLADCYLLALSRAVDSLLVTFDSGLNTLARSMSQEIIHLV